MPPKTVAQKLFIKEHHKVLLLDGPTGCRKTLGKLFTATVGLKGVVMFAVDNDWSAFRFKVVD